MLLAENEHGRYCIPHAAAHRPAAQTILAGGVHEPDTLALIIEHARGGTVITAGTFFGDFLPALHHARVTVRAFEPNHDNWLHAVATLYRNRITDIPIGCVALGEADYAAHLVVSETRRGHAYALGGGSFVNRDGKGQPVDVRALDAILGNWASPVTVLHFDVEGYEANALVGARQIIARDAPLVILERVPPNWQQLLPGYHIAGSVHRNTVFAR